MPSSTRKTTTKPVLPKLPSVCTACSGTGVVTCAQFEQIVKKHCLFCGGKGTRL
jgi:DnaJ-class molecular chaperone